jgi:hypothetical protein
MLPAKGPKINGRPSCKKSNMTGLRFVRGKEKGKKGKKK